MKFYLFGTMRTCFLMQLVLLAVFFVSVSVARADIITFQYEGELTDVDALLEGTFSVGDSFAGTYTFNSDTPINGDFGAYYEYPNAIIDMSFNSGNFMASADNGTMAEDYFDRVTADFYIFSESISSPSINGLNPNYMLLNWYKDYGYVSIFDPDPSFNPYSPTPWEIFIERAIYSGGADPDEVDLNYFDVNGNLVYSYETGVIGNPNQALFRSNGTRVSPNGRFYLSFINAQDQRSIVRGKLNSITLASNILTIAIPDNKWIQIGLNTAPPPGSTVADIVGDDISAPYGSEWVVYSYQTSTNSYKQLSLTDTMHPGIGYWFIQITGNPITIDMPNASTAVNVTQSPACSSFEGCFEIPLQTSNSIDNQWQMIGYPFRDSRNINKVRVVTAGLGSDCVLGCTLKEANEKGLVSEPLYHFDGTSYQQLTTEGSDYFYPWDGAWIATLPAASGQQPKLLIPTTN